MKSLPYASDSTLVHDLGLYSNITGPAHSIYFATDRGGLKAYSLETSSVRTIGNSSDSIFGVAYDSVNDKIYWCSATSIYRADQDGTELETVSRACRAFTVYSMLYFSTNFSNVYSKHPIVLSNVFPVSDMQGLSFDWITANLYVVTGGGNIIACDTNLERAFTCATVLTGQGDVEGLALHPTKGYSTNFFKPITFLPISIENLMLF